MKQRIPLFEFDEHFSAVGYTQHAGVKYMFNPAPKSWITKSAARLPGDAITGNGHSEISDQGNLATTSKVTGPSLVVHPGSHSRLRCTVLFGLRCPDVRILSD